MSWTQPKNALLQRFMAELTPSVARLREQGWPVEIIVVNEPDFCGVRAQLRLDYMPTPSEAELIDHGLPTSNDPIRGGSPE